MPSITQTQALEMIHAGVVDFTVTHIAMIDKKPEEIFAMIENILIHNEQYCTSICKQLAFLFPPGSDKGRKKTLAILICNKVVANKELRTNANTASTRTPEQNQILLNGDNPPPNILINIYDWLTKIGD
jgi:hypothetical protein